MLNPGWLDVAYMNYVFPDCFRQQPHNPQFPKGKYWFYIFIRDFLYFFASKECVQAQRACYVFFLLRQPLFFMKNKMHIDDLKVEITSTKHWKTSRFLSTIFLFFLSFSFSLSFTRLIASYYTLVTMYNAIVSMG